MAKTIILTDITGAKRDVLAAIVIKGRLGFAIRAGRTDGHALAAARRLAETYGWTEGMKTMKQALRFIEKFVEVAKSAE